MSELTKDCIETIKRFSERKDTIPPALVLRLVADLEHMTERATKAEAELHELREAISPGRTANAGYYVKVAATMRSRELAIRLMTEAMQP